MYQIRLAFSNFPPLSFTLGADKTRIGLSFSIFSKMQDFVTQNSAFTPQNEVIPYKMLKEAILLLHKLSLLHHQNL